MELSTVLLAPAACVPDGPNFIEFPGNPLGVVSARFSMPLDFDRFLVGRISPFGFPIGRFPSE